MTKMTTWQAFPINVKTRSNDIFTFDLNEYAKDGRRDDESVFAHTNGFCYGVDKMEYGDASYPLMTPGTPNSANKRGVSNKYKHYPGINSGPNEYCTSSDGNADRFIDPSTGYYRDKTSDDPVHELLLFSKSFKKVKRTQTLGSAALRRRKRHIKRRNEQRIVGNVKHSKR